MQTSRLRASVLGGLLVAAAIPLAATPAGANEYAQRVVVRAGASDGTTFAEGTTTPRVSAEGLWLGFSRPGAGAYVKSLVSGATELVSLSSAGQPANQPATVLGVGAGGRRVLFETAATNMADGPATAVDLYVRDRTLGSTTRVNRGVGNVAVAVKAGQGVLSDDGLSVAFATATNQVIVRRWTASASERVDVSSTEVAGNGGSKEPALSADGRFVAFTSSSSDLVAPDNNFAADVFVRDTQAGTTSRASLGTGGVAPNLPSGEPAISDDGRYVAFSTESTNVVAGDTNNSQDVFRRDLTNLVTVRASVTDAEAQAAGDSGHPDISADGHIVAFDSNAANLDSTQSANNKTDVFERYVSTAQTFMFAVLTPTQATEGASDPVLTADGAAIAYASAALFLALPDQNGASDVFVEGQQAMGPFTGHGALVTRLTNDFHANGYADAATTEFAVQQGRITPSHLILTFSRNPAWADHREPVARLYEAFFHREPDLGGFQHWVKKHEGGLRLGRIAAEFARSSEFQNTYGSLSNSAFVGLVYGNVLQRKADAAGLLHWTKKLDAGMSRGDLMVQFSESSEGKRTLAPQVDATVMGLAMFAVMPPKALYEAAAKAGFEHGEEEWVALTYLLSHEYEVHIQN